MNFKKIRLLSIHQRHILLNYTILMFCGKQTFLFSTKNYTYDTCTFPFSSILRFLYKKTFRQRVVRKPLPKWKQSLMARPFSSIISLSRPFAFPCRYAHKSYTTTVLSPLPTPIMKMGFKQPMSIETRTSLSICRPNLKKTSTCP